MADPIIEIKKVSKSYDIRGMNYRTFREKVSSLFGVSESEHKAGNTLWALKDISFDVREGEAVGIIGANGSGKTTMLRLLAGVTSQTSGDITVRGKIAPLIQVGAGFHPELTGRENIYLNGIILGLSKREIDGKFNEIVAFAELERFIDTPVKKYSSGMYVRLGFSVAIHINADILLIDEILSVGDLAFQRKCLDAMSNFRKSQKTIVFVSHNLSAVRGLCDRVLWLNQGRMEISGGPEAAIAAYTQYMTRKSEFIHDCGYVGQKTRWGTGEIRFEKITIRNSKGEETDSFSFGEAMCVNMEFKAEKKIISPTFWAGIISDQEIKIGGTYFNKERAGSYAVEGGGALQCTFSHLYLRPGVYHLMVGVYDEYGSIAFDRIGRARSFTVKCDYKDDLEKFRGYGAEGMVDFENEWKLEEGKHAK